MKNNEKQRLLIEYLLSSVDTFALCKSIIMAKYFDPEYRKTVEFIHTYYDTYSTVPSIEQVKAETDVELKYQEVTRDKIEYCANEIEAFCKNKAMEYAVLAAPDLIYKEDYGKVESLIKDAVSVSLHRNLGIEYFEDPLTRLERLASQPIRMRTLWKDIDDLLGGGLAKTEMALFCANSGGGKSITLANLATNFLIQDLDVIYLTLELSEDMVAQRFDIIFTGIPSITVQTTYRDIAKKITEVAIGKGNLTIKWMPSGTNANDIRAYLKEYELKKGRRPALLIVDYLDLMGANEHVSADNVWEKDKRATEQLRDIGSANEYNLYMATASQLNRSAIDAELLHQGHTAGGISKVNTVDWQIAIQHPPAMKAAGEIMMTFLKSRSSDAVGKFVTLGWDNKFLRIHNLTEDDEADEFKAAIQKKSSKGLPGKSNNNLLDIMNITNI